VTLGQLNYQGGRGLEPNHAKAYEYFQKAAETGNPNAQGYLGKMYAEGVGNVEQSITTALKYFHLAVEQKNPIGQAGLATMFMYGKGVEKDMFKAFHYFKLSADQGWAEGQLQLGYMHFKGWGTKRDYKQAVQLFNLAAQNGHILALYYLAKMHTVGIGVTRSCKTAVELFKNVCERGYWANKLDMAHSQYKKGNINSALSAYSLLAEMGYEVAQSNVAYILDKGMTSALFNIPTAERALQQWQRAADQGYSTARIKLGDYHYYGIGTEVDYETAAEHYKKCSEESKSAQALFNLGYMHEQGLGFKRDIYLAKRHYDMALEANSDAATPVALALMKIGLLFSWDFLQNHKWIPDVPETDWSYVPTYLSSFFSDNWDLYLMTILALVLGFVVAFRRQHIR